MPAPIPIRDQFTDIQKQEVVALFNSGLTQAQIAKRLSVPRCTIIKLCAILGLKRNQREAQATHKSKLDNEETVAKIRSWRDAYTLQEIAEKLESSTSAVERICAKHGIMLSKEAFRKSQSAKMTKAWTPEKRDECRERVKENLQTHPEILDKLRKARKLRP